MIYHQFQSFFDESNCRIFTRKLFGSKRLYFKPVLFYGGSDQKETSEQIIETKCKTEGKWNMSQRFKNQASLFKR